MPEKTPRLCVEFGGAYPAEDQTRFCIYPTALGACRGQILPKPVEPPKEKRHADR